MNGTIRAVATSVAFTALISLAACTAGEGGPAGEPPSSVSPADDAAAARLVGVARTALGAGEAQSALDTAKVVLERYARTPAAGSARWIAARAAFEVGRYDLAVRLAEEHASRVEGAEAAEARRLVARAREAERRANERVVIGAIVPRTGPAYLRQYGELVMQGVQLAFNDAGANVELIVLDDEGDPARAAALLDQLESMGARAIIGPMLTEGLRQAAQSRDSEVVLVSPTASDLPRLLDHAYTLNAPDARGADSLASYALRAGARTAAVMFPRIATHEREARAFRDTFEDGGGFVTEWVPYDSAATTFGAQLERIAQAGADVLFLPLNVRGVRLVAPQISYYGLDTTRTVLLGNGAWLEEEVRRLVGSRHLEGIVAAAQAGAVIEGPAWTDFVRVYEEQYQQSLDNPFPALGYDAARLLIEALVPGQNAPADVARRLASGLEVEGASGVLAVRNGVLTRRPFLVRIEDGRLVPAPAPAMLLQPSTTAPRDGGAGGGPVGIAPGGAGQSVAGAAGRP